MSERIESVGDGLKRFLMGGKVLVGFWVTKGWVVYKEVYNLF